MEDVVHLQDQPVHTKIYIHVIIIYTHMVEVVYMCGNIIEPRKHNTINNYVSTSKKSTCTNYWFQIIDP